MLVISVREEVKLIVTAPPVSVIFMLSPSVKANVSEASNVFPPAVTVLAPIPEAAAAADTAVSKLTIDSV